MVWLVLGGTNIIAAHQIACAFGDPDKSIHYPFVHVFSGSDAMSCFAGHEKRSV